MKKFIEGITVGIIASIIVAMAMYFITDWLNKKDSRKIIAYLPYANDYFYKKGGTYKGATSSPSNNMSRDVDQNDPLPLDLKKGEQKLTIGVRNSNPKTINDVKLFLEMPNEFTVTTYYPWTQYTDKAYYIPLGNINSGVGHTAVEPIFFTIKKSGKYKIIYSITGSDFEKITRVITFDIYE